MKIGIDMGHTLSGAGTGAVGYVKETDKNRQAGKRLIEMLKEKGHTVVNCTVDSSSNDLADRVRKANAQSLDLFVSLHLNAYQKVSGEMGVETYSLSTSGTGRDKAVAIQKALVSTVGWKDRGVKTNNFYVLRNTNAPAVLTELGFCDSQGDMNKWDTEKIAKALFKGITGSDYVSSTPAPSPSQPSTGEFKTGSYNGKVKATSNLNVRSGRGTEHGVIGTLAEGTVVEVMYILPDDRDGKGNSDLWGSITFNGKTGYIHLGYVTPVAASTPAPAPKPPSDDDIIKEYAEKGYAIPRVTVNVRNKPSTVGNDPVAKYIRGERINNYDKVVVTNAYTWISYVSTSGTRRYVAVKNQKTGERYADCY